MSITETGELETLEPTEDTIDTDDTNQDDQPTDDTDDEVEKLRKEAYNQRIRAEKAETRLKNIGSGEKATVTPKNTEQSSTLTTKDLLAIVNAGVSEDDIDEVADYAKFKNISIADALKSSTMKSILAEKKEIRATANATNTSTTPRGNGQTSVNKLLSDFEKGILPESKEERFRLFEAQQKARK